MAAKVKTLKSIRPLRQYMKRIGAVEKSLNKLIVEKERDGDGYKRQVCSITVKRDGTISCPKKEYQPNDDEQDAIQEAFRGLRWPRIKPLSRIKDPPKQVSQASQEDLFLFKDEKKRIIFVQVRVQTAEGKAYLPFSYWDDDEWRQIEPDQMPLYNLHKLKDNAIVFLHEGAKAARAMQTLVEGKTQAARNKLSNHPWKEELSTGVHLGWAGGVHATDRIDWSPLSQHSIMKCYIVADNDAAGVRAVPRISKKLKKTAYSIQFTDEFPRGFDLADDFPFKMFGRDALAGFYTGPSFRDCLHPATWITELLPNPSGRGRPVAVIREAVRGMWAYIEESDIFVCREMPEILRREPILNKMLSPFSDVKDPARLIVNAYEGRQVRLCYAPEHPGQQVTWRGSSAINIHIPSGIRAKAGDTTPWLEFLAYMFPSERDRKSVEKWIATLIARPDVRMGYALLLVSEAQGIGKTTLGAHILAPLVGMNNVSFPGHNDITSQFNSWVANKRLAVVSEIYQGHSWQAYNILKGIITDYDVMVNEKYMPQYIIQNWCHIFASSNSLRALRMESDDRRWFYPSVVEYPWKREKFNELRSWINGGGLNVIRHWAENYPAYITPADRAPMTERKLNLIEDSRSDAQKEAVALGEMLAGLEEEVCITQQAAVAWIYQKLPRKRVYDTDYELRKAIQEGGLKSHPSRMKLQGRTHYVLYNRQFEEIIAPYADEGRKREAIRQALRPIHEYIEGEM